MGYFATIIIDVIEEYGALTTSLITLLLEAFIPPASIGVAAGTSAESKLSPQAQLCGSVLKSCGERLQSPMADCILGYMSASAAAHTKHMASLAKQRQRKPAGASKSKKGVQHDDADVETSDSDGDDDEFASLGKFRSREVRLHQLGGGNVVNTWHHSHTSPLLFFCRSCTA
jgi:hypothetical protein